MRQAWQPGDRAYVYYGGEKAFLYYARRFGFAPEDYVLGRCAREDPRVYLRELDAFRGRPRTWLVVTHAVPEETTAIRSYLDRIGTRRASFEAGNAPGTRRSDRARVDLYDLSDPARPGERHGGGVPHAAPGRRRPGGGVVLPPGSAIRRRDRRPLVSSSSSPSLTRGSQTKIGVRP